MGTFTSALDAILEGHGLSEEFPPEVLRETDAFLRDAGVDDPTLGDLEALPFVTVDNPDSRDLDQALYIEDRGAGDAQRARFTVWYALADPLACAPPGTHLFAEALRRGATIYLPGRSVPMLPRKLSEGQVSLLPGVPRRALVFQMDVDDVGCCTATKVLRARVRSRAQLTYEGVTAFLEAPEHPWATEPWGPSLRALEAVGRRRITRAELAGVVQYSRTNVEVVIDGGSGLAFVRLDRRHAAADRYNEQVSLLCNMEGARLLQEASLGPMASQVQPIYRVHPAPEPARLAHFAALSQELAAEWGHGPDWCWSPASEPLSLFLSRVPVEGPGGDLGRALHRQALVTNFPGSFSAEPGGHHGVGARAYARFSAPMREVVGVFLHKELLEALGAGSAPRPGAPDDEALRLRVVAAANRSKVVQASVNRAVNAAALDALFGAELRLPEEARAVRSGVVVGFEDGRVHVTLDDPPMDVKVYHVDLSELLGGPVEATRVRLRVAGAPRWTLRLGSRLALRVLRRDGSRQRWVLRPLAAE
ncbi:MAG: RNB domain-containing ribonuclease [Deltaproteobacteria bacterium]|nr:RNB domain-containing ribonuclease [Deltaproteobacteria bacterium]